MLFRSAAASAERIQEVLDVQPAIVDPVDPKPQTERGTISFKDVDFRYPGAEEPVLRNLNFDIRPGAFTAIVGGTGSGKTTVIGMLARFFDVSAGQVLVGGTDVREQSLETLYASMGLVPQRAYLFGGTIRENVKFGAPALTDDEVWRALEIAQAADYVREFEGGQIGRAHV